MRSPNNPYYLKLPHMTVQCFLVQVVLVSFYMIKSRDANAYCYIFVPLHDLFKIKVYLGMNP